MNFKLLLNRRFTEHTVYQQLCLVTMLLLFSALGVQAQTVTTDKDDYSPGQYVIITGSGWQPGERVDFSFEETPKPATCVNPHDLYATADADGNIYNNQFLVKDNHLGVAFVLTATGQNSGLTAVTYFTDAGIKNVSVEGTSFCAGQTISVSFEAVSALKDQSFPNEPNGNFGNNNYFVVELSNSSGSFSSRLEIGRSTTTLKNGSHTITATLPAVIPFGAGYKVRVLSTDPVTNAPESSPFTIYAQPTTANAGPDQLNIAGTSITLAGNNPSVGTGTWSIVSGTGGSIANPLNRNSQFSGVAGNTYTLRWTINNESCTSFDDVIVSFNNIIATTTTLASSVNPSVYAQTITFTATVAPTSGSSTPTGNVVFKNGSDVIGTVALSSVSGAQRAIFSTSALPVNTSGHSITAIYQGAGSFVTSTSNVLSQVVNKAPATVTLAGLTGQVYNGAAKNATATTNPVGLTVEITYNGSATEPTNAGSYTVVGTINNPNYQGSATGTLTIGKADATIAVEGFDGKYDGAAHGATGSAKGVKGETLTGLDLGASFTNVPGGTANWKFTDVTGNYNDASGTAAITIGKADATIAVEGFDGKYDGAAHGATGSAKGVKGETLTGLDLGASFTNVPGGTANWKFTDVTGNYNDASGTAAITIGKADATIAVEGFDGKYDGAAHGATGSAKGVKGETLTGLDLGASFTNVPGGTANWKFTDVTGNYNDASGTAAITIGKADATIAVEGFDGKYDGAAHGATGSAKGVKGETLTGLDLGASFTNVPGGTANWKFTDVTGNYNDASGTAAITIGKADATIAVEGFDGKYDGAAHGATGSAKGVKGETLTGLDLGASFTNVPGGTANWKFTDVTGNYNDASGTAAITIGKADATIAVEGFDGKYDGAAHGATGSAKGVKGETLTGLDLGASFTNVPGGTANWKFTDVTGNYNDASGTAAITIGKADATIAVEGFDGKYDGAAHGATGSAKGVKGETLTGLDLGASFTNVPGGTANWKFTDVTGNYNDASGTAAITIGKADATIAVEGFDGKYDGAAHGATGSAKGVKGETLTGLDLGASFTNVPGGTANWKFTDVTGNYNDASGTAAITIGKADATIAVEGFDGKYDGAAHGATGSAKGVKGETLTGLDLGASFTNVPGGTANWKFTDVTGNYNDASGTAAITIGKADATIAVEGFDGKYDGAAHGATGSAKGVKGETLTGLDLGASFTNVPGGTANWKFTDVTGNYNDASGTAAITIGKADATIAVEGFDGKYDGAAHGATGSAKGVKGETLTGLDLGASFTNVPGGTANWKFTDVTGNYNDASGTAAITIGKADATIAVEGFDGKYDGAAHGATGSAKGVKGETLTGLDLGASFTNVPGGTANWKFTDVTGNYNDASGTAAITIGKADATIAVEGFDGKYDGAAHGATGSAKGVKGETLTGLDLGASFTNVPGGTANWKFTDVTGNYNDASGTAAITIGKADATIAVEGFDGKYDGAAHGATGSAKGVKGETLTGLDLGASFTNVPGGTANWKFTDVTGNYNDASGTAAITIGKADATIAVEGFDGKYDGAAHGATGSAKGVKGETLTGLDLGASFTNVPGGTANWKFTDVTGNYNDASGTAAITIGKADATIAVEGFDGKYDGAAHGATGSAKGVKGETLTGLDLGASFTNVPGGTANWKFTDVTGNYNDASGTAAITIGKADATIAVEGFDGKYDGAAHGATGSAKGVKGETLTGLDLGASFTNVPGGTANWKFTDVTGNYNDASGTAAITIGRRPVTISVNAGQIKYCGQSDKFFTYTASESLLLGNSFSGELARNVGESVGSYSYNLGTLSAGNNYYLSLVGDAKFEIKGSFIDAYASSSTVQIKSTAAPLIAIVTDASKNPVSKATVYFTLHNNLGVEVAGPVEAQTGLDGSVSTTIDVSSLPLGVYQVKAKVGSGCAIGEGYLTIFDMTENFITGGGWINSPKLAYTADLTLEGKASFGFVSKYKKGSNAVDGNTEFQFHVGNFNFKSNLQQAGSLVISSFKATYRGEGTVNGSGRFGFMVSALDGAISGSGGEDRFRIKIWDINNENRVVYDNQISAENADLTTEGTLLGGGSIVIHEIKSAGKTTTTSKLITESQTQLEQPLTFYNYPNAFSDRTTVAFSVDQEQSYLLEVYDVKGALVKKVSMGVAKANKLYEFEVDGRNLAEGIYIARLVTGTKSQSLKMILKK